MNATKYYAVLMDLFRVFLGLPGPLDAFFANLLDFLVFFYYTYFFNS